MDNLERQISDDKIIVKSNVACIIAKGKNARIISIAFALMLLLIGIAAIMRAR